MAFRSCASESDLFDSYLASPPKNEVLLELNSLIDWPALRRVVAPAYSADPRGREAFDPVLMIKMILLQRLYGLSDPAMESEAQDRLSFRQFLGLTASDPVPDETTLVVFRKRLRSCNRLEALQQAINSQLTRRGLMVREGSITVIDASLIPAATNPPTKKERAAEQTRKDTEADFTVRGAKTHFGYKLHIAQDRQTGMITAHEVTPASVHDSQVFEQLLDGSEAEVLADKAYDSRKRRQTLARRGTKASILRKGTRSRGLSWWWAAHNKTLSRVRNFVESTFATLKLRQGCARAVYCGLEKVREQMTWSILAFNLRRAIALKPPERIFSEP
jgi:IS5 family transposase